MKRRILRFNNEDEVLEESALISLPSKKQFEAKTTTVAIEGSFRYGDMVYVIDAYLDVEFAPKPLEEVK